MMHPNILGAIAHERMADQERTLQHRLTARAQRGQARRRREADQAPNRGSTPEQAQRSSAAPESPRQRDEERVPAGRR